MSFALFVCHPFGTFRVTAEREFTDLDSAIDAGLQRIAESVFCLSVWIATPGELPLVLSESDFTPQHIAQSRLN